ncbi:hypothetical protein [Gilvimarinus sp. 1_MG-2023]|uniref:hypothetical protein n=1 Tax=Gilvimarinus sp. 1_MG-2023 TaxID=3062638 RepID=UPI0026E128AF|nr:hypothetical protein [Gilvimarinus sp. 1_MG-2023]MDO6746894.1 hypothetical protein [Gilvimarinus sp. 1_MG-2023]
MKNRIKAFGVHLAISVVIFLAILALVYFVWFPGVLFHAGAWQGLKIIAFVDLVLGPVLTFVVFNTKKKSLKWDLAAVGLLQIACLVYGLMQLEQQRIVSVVLMADQLSIVHKMDLERAGVEVSDLRHLGGGLPVLAFYDLPEDTTAAKVELQIMATFKGQPQLQVDNYIPMHNALNDETINKRLQWRLDRLRYNIDEQCYWVDIEDKYVDGEACFAPQYGVKQLVQYKDEATLDS